MKETETISKLGIVDKIYIVGLWRDGLPEEEVVDEKRTIVRIKLWSRRLGERTLPKSLKLAEWMSRIAGRFLTKEVRLANIHYLAGLPIGVFFKVFKRAVLVYDTHELEAERTGWGKGRRRMAKLLERALVKIVDKTIVSSPSYATWYGNAYGIHPYVVLNAPRYATVTNKDLFRKRFNIPSNKVLFLYHGALGDGRSIENILEAFCKTRDTEKVVVFMGYGPLEEAVKTASEKHSNIFFHPAVAPDVLLDYAACADVGFCLIQDISLSYRYTLPNKMFEYAMAGLPVVAPNFGDMKTLAETYQIGYVLEDASVEGILDLINRVSWEDISTFKSNLAKFKEIFNWEKQEETLALVYRDLQVASK